MGKARIMVVEDEKITAEIIKKALQKLGYSISSVVASGEQALIKAKEDRPDLILMDIVLEGEMDGIEAAQQIRLQNNVPVIYLSSYSEEELIQRAKVTEPYAYILKPFKDRELHINIEISLYRHQLEQELKRAYAKLKKTLRSTIGAMSMIAEIGDPFLTGHQQRTAQLACAIAKRMDLEKDQIETIWLASVIHDLGLISIPFELCHKPDRSKKEQDLYNTHTEIGYNLSKPMDFEWPVAEIILQHHERVNGSGYPHGLSGEEILLEARILAVADMVETKTSHRPYRPPFELSKVLEEISVARNILYDEKVVDACLKLFKDRRYSTRYPLEHLT